MTRMAVRVFAVVLALTGVMLTPSAHAQWILKQDTGLYLGAAVGQAKVRNLCSDAASLGFGSCDEKDTAWKVSAGYQFHRNFGVEAGYVDWGKQTFSNGVATGTIESHGFELLGVASVPLYRNFSAYAKAGLVRWEADFTAAAGGATLTANDKGTDFTYGLGLSYDITTNFAARVEWQRYTDIVMDMWSLGVVYKFR